MPRGVYRYDRLIVLRSTHMPALRIGTDGKGTDVQKCRSGGLGSTLRRVSTQTADPAGGQGGFWLG
jgi:hypothetical protein